MDNTTVQKGDAWGATHMQELLQQPSYAIHFSVRHCLEQHRWVVVVVDILHFNVLSVDVQRGRSAAVISQHR